MNCFIVDDNKVARMMVRNLLEQTGMVTITGECSSAAEARDALAKSKVDLMILDIEMPGMSGIDLLQVLPEKPVIIFLTSKTGYALEAFDLNVVDYLVKPPSLARLQQALQKAKEVVDSREVKVDKIESTHLFIKDGKALIKLAIDDIIWLEAMGDYIKFHTTGKNHLVHISLRELENKFSPKLLRVHRSYMVAVDRIDYIEDSFLYISNQPIPISDTYRQSLLQRLKLL